MPSPPRSALLARRYPRRVEIPLLLFAAGAMLTLGLTLPALQTRTLFFWKDEYSVLLNIVRLNEEGKRTAAVILAACSVVYPAIKFILLGYFWFMPFPHGWRFRVIRMLRLLGRWAMVDVLTIVSIVAASMTIGPLQATPRAGLFLFAGGIFALMLAGLAMERLARKGVRRR